MRHPVLATFGTVLALLSVALMPGGDAIVDDFEQDFWLPFTHANLGDRAAAGYSRAYASSGTRSYHVEIRGWAVRDFGSAYGHALFRTGGAAPSRLFLSILHADLSDASPSPWDGFASGISLQLLDATHRTLGTMRYIVAYRASLNAGRCGPVSSDVVLGRSPTLGTWQDVGRSLSEDFPGAAWSEATFLRVSVGFLCAAGLTGASYSLYFDDFALDADAGDSDRDGIEDLEEETVRYVLEVSAMAAPRDVPDEGDAIFSIDAPRVRGVDPSVAVRIAIDHARPIDLSVHLAGVDGERRVTQTLWDPGFHERGVAILSPEPEAGVSGTVRVRGRSSILIPGGWAHLYVDDRWESVAERALDGSFDVAWASSRLPEGDHRLRVEIGTSADPGSRGPASRELPVVVDITQPSVTLEGPVDGTRLGGLVTLVAHPWDSHRIDHVRLLVDGFQVDARDAEPYAFVYETLDVPNGVHVFTVRAFDAAGNPAEASVHLEIDNAIPPILPPCQPACNFSPGTSSGNLSRPDGPAIGREVRLHSGDLLRATTSWKVPWAPGVVVTETGVQLTLEVIGSAPPMDPGIPRERSLRASDLPAFDRWEVLVRDHASGSAGLVRELVLSFALRSTPGMSDTDEDGVPDGVERSDGATLPVLADSDDDGLDDGTERAPQDVLLVIDGLAVRRTLHTDPFDPDSDDDGLRDAEELAPRQGVPLTDPTASDTDDDALTDGREVADLGTDPTRKDTDGDGFEDGYETTPRNLTLVVNGTARSWDLTTSPILLDTDDDGIDDASEEQGRNDAGIVTHPELPDTDEDGLNDSEELRIGTDGFRTNPLSLDADEDGVWDSLDKLPLHEASIGFLSEYPPGMVRFDQEMFVWWLQGTQAAVWKREDDFLHGTYDCLLVSNDVAGSTRTSVVTTESVVGSVNDMFTRGGETRYQAVSSEAGSALLRETSVFGVTYGDCDEVPNEYYIEYLIHRDIYSVAFRNVAPVTIEDADGTPFRFNFTALPVELGESFSIIIQLSYDPARDRTQFSDYDNWLSPAFSYAVYGSPDFDAAPILLSATAIATELDEHAYRVELKVPGSSLGPDDVGMVDGIPTVGLLIGPQWTGRRAGEPVRDAMDPAEFRIASITRARTTNATLLVVRMASDAQDLLVEHTERMATLPLGVHVVEGRPVYVFRTEAGVPFDASLLDGVEAVILVGSAESDLFAARDSIDWGSPGTWYATMTDPWGSAVRAFRDSLKIVRLGVSVSQFADLLRFRYASPGSYLLQGDRETTILVDKGQIGDSAAYTVSLAESQEEFLIEVVSGEVVVRRQLTYQVTQTDVTTDLSASRIFSSRYDRIKSSLRALNAGAVLVTNGREAVIAFVEGDTVKGAVYTSNAALGLLGIYQGNKDLVKLLGIRSERLGALKLGTVTQAAAGALLVGLELQQALTAPDELSKRAHLERASASTIDTVISIVPLYGPATTLGWSVATLALSHLMPNRLAATITSSPGSTIVFLVEYFFSGTIPSSVANAVLNDALALTVQFAQDTYQATAIPIAIVQP